MKQLAWILILCSPLALQAQSHTLEKLWETDSIVATPESVLPNPSKAQLYISLIDGGPWEDDKKGGVGLLNTDGTNYNGTWVTGLSAPKGMGVFENRLYVADMNRVVVIDRKKGAILKKIVIEGAVNLNDISVDHTNGDVYVSDSKTGKLYRIINDTPSLYMQDLPGINGLKVSKNGLYILAKKQVLLADASRNTRTIADLPHPLRTRLQRKDRDGLPPGHRKKN